MLSNRSTISIHTKFAVKNKNRLRTIIACKIKPIAMSPNRKTFSKKTHTFPSPNLCLKYTIYASR